MKLKVNRYQFIVKNNNTKQKCQNKIQLFCCGPAPLSSPSTQKKNNQKSEDVFQFMPKQNFNPNKLNNTKNQQKQEVHKRNNHLCQSFIYSEILDKKMNQFQNKNHNKVQQPIRKKVSMHFIESKKLSNLNVKSLKLSLINESNVKLYKSKNHSFRQSKVIDQSTTTFDSLNLSIKLQNYIPKTPKILQQRKLFLKKAYRRVLQWQKIHKKPQIYRQNIIKIKYQYLTINQTIQNRNLHIQLIKNAIKHNILKKIKRILIKKCIHGKISFKKDKGKLIH